MSPQTGVTEDRVRVIVNDVLRQYEVQYGERRHKENQEKFDQLFEVMNRNKGGDEKSEKLAKSANGWLKAVFAGILVVIAILTYFLHDKNAAQSMIHTSQVTVAQAAKQTAGME